MGSDRQLENPADQSPEAITPGERMFVLDGIEGESVTALSARGSVEHLRMETRNGKSKATEKTPTTVPSQGSKSPERVSNPHPDTSVVLEDTEEQRLARERDLAIQILEQQRKELEQAEKDRKEKEEADVR